MPVQFRWSALLVLLLLPVAAQAGEKTDPGATATATMAIEIPRLPLAPTNFALRLEKLCLELDREVPADLAAAPRVLGGAGSSSTLAMKQLRDAIDSLPATSVCPAAPAGVKVGPGAEQAIRLVDDVVRTCRKIPAEQPLDQDDWTLLHGLAKHRDLFVRLARHRSVVDGCRDFAQPVVAGDWSGGVAAVASTSAGGLESMLINGLATFVATRFKAEAVLYLQAQVQQHLCTDRRLPLFFNTCQAFSQVRVSLSPYAMGAFLKAAARRDLERLPDTLIARQAAEQPAQRDALTAVRFGLAFLDQLRLGRDPLEVARSLHGAPLLPCERDSSCIRAPRALRSGSRLLHAVLQQEQVKQLVSDGKLSKLEHLPYYLVSIWISWEDNGGIEPTRVASTAATAQEIDPVLLMAAARQILPALMVFYDELTQFTKPSGSGPASSAYTSPDQPEQSSGPDEAARWTLLVSALDLVLEVSAATHPDPALQPTWQALRHLVGFCRLAGEPGSAGNLLIGLFDLLLQLDQDLAPQPGLSAQLDPDVRRLLTLLVELGNARSSDEVAKTLEAAAAPVGSYHAKYGADSMSINAFVGPSIGRELLGDRQPSGTVLTLAAPIGFHFSTPAELLGQQWHYGMLLTVLDLGNLVSHRLDGKKERVDGAEVEVAEEPAVTLQEVLSPGLFATLGLFGSPLVLGAGLQAVPEARIVTVTDPQSGKSSTSKPTAARLSVFLAMDLTLFPL